MLGMNGRNVMGESGRRGETREYSRARRTGHTGGTEVEWAGHTSGLSEGQGGHGTGIEQPDMTHGGTEDVWNRGYRRLVLGSVNDSTAQRRRGRAEFEAVRQRKDSARRTHPE